MKSKRKILNLNVKNQFQVWLLVRIIGTVILSSLVAAIILYFYSRQEISSNFYSAHIKLRRVSDLLLPVIAAGTFVSLISGMILALFLPQKIAGPLYHIEKDLRKMGAGNLKVKIRLRKKDTMDDFVKAININIKELRKKVQAVKDAQGELEKSLAENQNPEVNKQMGQLKSALDIFKS